MPNLYPCSNTYCQNSTTEPFTQCEDCKRRVKNNQTHIDKHNENSRQWEHRHSENTQKWERKHGKKERNENR